MGIFVFGELWAKLARTTHERASYRFLLAGLRVHRFDCSDDERTNRCPGAFRAMSKPVVQRFRDVDSSTNGHDITMS